MITIQDIAFVRYQATDLGKMESFLSDFGMQRSAITGNALYMRGTGDSHHIHVTQLGDTNKALGFGLRAGSAQDLTEFSGRIGAPVEDNPEPGGGCRVRFTDPAGFVVDVIHGQQRLPLLPTRPTIARNDASSRNRVGQPVRVQVQPSHVVRIGHVLGAAADLKSTLAFYTQNLGFRVSDRYWGGVEENTVAAFLHCGLGERWTDHHTLAFVQAADGVSRMDHSAFEVLDFDDVYQGGAHLEKCGYTRSWGIGRHVQGSQVFDYWRDPFDNKIEHWTDGDLVNDDSPVGHAPISPDGLAQWGSPLTPEFFR
jgi:catechol 2,3-dioxygenase-like lactoylglutathione lyase family enzyme